MEAAQEAPNDFQHQYAVRSHQQFMADFGVMGAPQDMLMQQDVLMQHTLGLNRHQRLTKKQQ